MTEETANSAADEVRPGYVPAVVYPAAMVAVGWGLLTLVLHAIHLVSGFRDVSPAVVLAGMAGIGLLVVMLTVLQCRARWGKTCLRFGGDRVVFETGGLGTKSTVELVLRNVTHLSYTLPVVESRLLGSGRVTVESAGSGGAEVNLAHVADPKAVFARVQQLMARGGIELEPRQLLCEERPSLFGIALMVVGQGIAVSFVCTLILADMLGDVKTATLVEYAGVFAAVGLLMLCGLGVYIVGALLDASRQRCKLNDTSVVFEGGFPERATVIPIHNVSDSCVVQGLVDRILGLWTVNVSCQGARNEVAFTNLAGGHRFSELLVEHLRKLKQAAAVRSVIGDVAGAPAAAAPGVPGAAPGGVRPRLDLDRKFEASYRMTLLKNLFWPCIGVAFFTAATVLSVLFVEVSKKDGEHPFFFLALMAVINLGGIVRRFLEVFCTVYEVGTDDLTETYKFISTSTKRFAFDKVTAVVFVRSPVDWLLKTVTVKFYSIGSSTALTFKSIPWDEELEAKLAAKIGVQPQEASIVLPSRFSLVDMCKGRPSYLVLCGILACGAAAAVYSGAPILLVVGAAGILAALGILYPFLLSRTARLQFFDHSVLFTRGVVLRERTHVTYDNIKGVTATQYPLSSSGDLKVDIAGEAIPDTVQQQQQVKGAQAGALALLGNSFTVEFMENVMAEAYFFDCLQIDRPQRSEFQDLRARTHAHGRPKPVLETAPHRMRLLCLPVSVAALAIVAVIGTLIATGGSLLIGVLVALMVASLLGGYIAHVASYRYVIEHGAVALYKGVVTRTRFTITFDQIDFINVTQGVLDRAFGTGNVLVQTTGSSKAEMVLAGFRDHEAFGQELTKHYKGYAPGVAAEGMRASAPATGPVS